MTLFQKLNERAQSRGVGFLVIGGHAVIEHGYQRGTEDADILISKSDRAAWQEIVVSCGYTFVHDGGAFLQFKPDGSDGVDCWDLDLMLVSATVFMRLLAAAEPARIEGAAVSIPSLEHLIALKAHALKNGKGLRVLKDMTDVAELLKFRRVDPNSVWLKNVFEKYGNAESYERIIKLLA
jgi:predicted nucleotidyltransferase